MLPQPVKDIVGKTFKFGVAIEKENVSYGGDTYKVLKVWSTNNLLVASFQSETFSALETTFTSGDAVINHILLYFYVPTLFFRFY